MKKKKYIFSNLCEIPKQNSAMYPNEISHKFRVKGTKIAKTYSQFYHDIGAISAGLTSFGVESGKTVSIFCDNRYEWPVFDYALMGLNVISVPRGTDTSPVELIFIYKHSDSNFMILENAGLLTEILHYSDTELFNDIDKIFLIDGDEKIKYNKEKFPGLLEKIVFYGDLLDIGNMILEKNPVFYKDRMKKIRSDNVVSIVYTSGTTGNPKGVILTQSNFLHNVRAITPLLNVKNPGKEIAVSILPIWHVYERTYEYCCSASGVGQVYSNIKNFARDLEEENPSLVASVPRIWQSVYEKVIQAVKKKSLFARYIFFMFLKTNLYWTLSLKYMQGLYVSFKKRNIFIKFITLLSHLFRYIVFFPFHLLSKIIFKPIKSKMGENLRASFSGAGSLPRYVDNFFNSIGIILVNAYGMTEASPGILSRTLERNTIGSTGVPFAETEVRILNKEKKETSIGEKGVLYAKGPQVMKGYYKNIEKTEEILSKDGWLDTGDFAVRTENGDIIIVGRAKDTIVLLGGENVDPEPIEEKIKDIVYIDNAVVLGQDKKALEALITLNSEQISKLANELKIKVEDIVKDGEEIIIHSAVIKFLKEKMNSLIAPKHGFKRYEKITKLTVLNKKFEKGEELTQTLKIKRKFIEEKYKDIIEKVGKVFSKKIKK